MNRVHLLAMLLVAAIIGAVGGPSHAQNPPTTTLKIGILAKRGPENCLRQWQPTAEYLSESISGFSFEIVPLDFFELLPAVENRKIDLLLANSAYYVMAEKLYFVNRLATLHNCRLDISTTSFAGVIFTRADNPDIREISDLKGKSFAAVAPFSLGGWLAGRLELVQKGIDPEKDLRSLQFLGTHDAVVMAVRNGDVEAGTVRSDALERLELEGLLKLQEFRVLSSHHSPRCQVPFVHSTREYPEWPFAKLDHLDCRLARRISAALLSMPEDCPAAKASHSTGWHIPVSYEMVRENLRLQRIGPWKDFGRTTLLEVAKDHLPMVITVLLLLLLLALTTIKLNKSRLRLEQLAVQQQLNLQQSRETELELGVANNCLKETMDRLHQDETRLVQSEKLAAVGQVAAGVAHEINNPVGFIMSNLFTLQEYFNFLGKLTTCYQRLFNAAEDVEDGSRLECLDLIDRLLAEDDPDFIGEDGTNLIQESLAGTMRVKEIVLNLKKMAQVDAREWSPLDLNEGITAVQGVTNAKPEFLGEIRLDLQELPEIHGHPAELNQAILNLVTNAIQFSPPGEQVTVTSRHKGETILIKVADNGPGIPAEDLDRVFDPFFTTHPAGKGSGLGLPSARDIINRHGGGLTVESRPDQGTVFIISLPVASPTKNAPTPV